MDWFAFWLFVHILGAIVAFGPTFVFPLIAGSAERSRRDLQIFGLRLNHLIETRVVVPVALTMPISGAALIIDTHIDLAKTNWLTTAIGLYVVAVILAVVHQVPTTNRLIKLAEATPTAGPGGAAAAATASASEIAALFTRLKAVGGVLHLLVVTILVLMVWAPGGITYTR
jgi:hypothetical protein